MPKKSIKKIANVEKLERLQKLLYLCIMATIQPNASTRYQKFIAYLQAICIILVVLNHSCHQHPGYRTDSLPLMNLLATVRIPLFAFVSGYLMVYTTGLAAHCRIAPGKFIVSKIKRLLLPFAVLTTITFIPRAGLSGMADNQVDLSWNAFLKSFVYSDAMPVPYLWYLHASFILLVGSFLVLWLTERMKVPSRWGITVLAIALAGFAISELEVPVEFSLNEVKRLGVYFAAGCLYCSFSPKIDNFVPWTNPFLLFGAAVCWISAFLLLPKSDFRIITSLTGMIAFISLTKIIEQRGWKFLDHLTGSTYLIFLLSWYCNVIFLQVLSHFVTLPWWFHAALSLTAGIYIPWLGYRYLRKHQDSRWVRITSFLLGQSFKSKRK